MGTQEHWDEVYSSETPQEVSWFCPHLETSLGLIKSAASDRDAAIIDVGGGASTLVDDLLDRGYRKLTVLDISQSAIEVAKKRLDDRSSQVEWICADATRVPLPPEHYDVWHDRAVFHFLTQPEQRRDYVTSVTSSMKAGGHVIVSTFGPEGPTRCSGLDVVRYDPGSLHAEFGRRFRLIKSLTKLHLTPLGNTQPFVFCHFIFES